MNNIDKNFYILISEIENSTEEQLFEKIKLNFQFLPQDIKNIFENYFKRFDYWGTLSEQDSDFDEIKQKAYYLHNNIKDIVWLYQILEDYTSKFLLYSIINNWVNYDFQTLNLFTASKFKHYFDLDLIPNLKDEVFVDIGAYIGDSVLDFIESYGLDSYKKIYCYEITADIFNQLKSNLQPYPNITFINKAVKDKNGKIFIKENVDDSSSNSTCQNGQFAIDAVCLDDDIEEKISLIKMDIEGDEFLALQGAKNHIAKNCPKLLISIYHKNIHLTQLAKLIYSYNNNYKFYLRYHGGNIYPTEIVLFALPKNK